MPKVTFIHPDGTETTVEGRIGHSLMEVARDNNVTGIVAECGGAAMCATCHVFVDERFVTATGARNEIEEEMLDLTATQRRPTSRLSCQIKLVEAMEGLVLHLPGTQV